MTLIDMFVQGDTVVGVKHCRLPCPHTLPELRDALATLDAQLITDDRMIFIEDTDEPLGDSDVLDFDVDRPLILHVHRHHRIEVVVNFKEREESRRFSPATTVGRVQRWATRKAFELDPEEASEYVLQLADSTERPSPETHLGSLVRGDDCSLTFDLVLSERING